MLIRGTGGVHVKGRRLQYRFSKSVRKLSSFSFLSSDEASDGLLRPTAKFITVTCAVALDGCVVSRIVAES